MQGLQALNQFKNFVSSIGGLGRYEDTYIVHAAEGETVIPMEVLDKNPLLKKRLFKTMVDMGIEPGRYIVGNELNSKNPVTGQPEFFLKKLGKFVNRIMPGDSEKYLPIAAGFIPGMSALGAAGIGAGIGGLSAYGADRNVLEGALMGGAMGGGTRALTGRYGPEFLRYPTDKTTLFGGQLQADLGKVLGKVNPFAKSEEQKLLSKVNESLLADAKSVIENPNATLLQKKSARDTLESIMSGVDKSKKGLGTLGSLGTLAGGLALTGVLGSQIPKPQDAVIDPSKIRQPERTDDFAFAPNQTYTRPEAPSAFVPTTLAAKGGVMDLQDGGESKGPGTGTSDSIPAMLSDGEFVMTAKAVRGAGGGDRREGARKMYEAMDKLEAQA
jgi:hypothetical protein